MFHLSRYRSIVRLYSIRDNIYKEYLNYAAVERKMMEKIILIDRLFGRNRVLLALFLDSGFFLPRLRRKKFSSSMTISAQQNQKNCIFDITILFLAENFQNGQMDEYFTVSYLNKRRSRNAVFSVQRAAEIIHRKNN